MSDVLYPMQGVQCWTNRYGMDIVRLHYSADPEKDEAWAERARARCTSEGMWRQEYEIDFYALEGALLYHLDEKASIVDPFHIPHEWTRFFALDPHPVKPHAAIWGAVDPYGDLYIYREFWPSKVYGVPGGRVPEDDNQPKIREYVECIKFFESPDNPVNNGAWEHIYKRVIDYAARGQEQGSSNSPTFSNAQEFFEREMREQGLKNWKFEDAVKIKSVGEEAVNQWLAPRKVLDPGRDEYVLKSKLRIFSTCKEVIWQLKTNRRKPQTPQEAELRDPELKRIEKRNDLTDALRYLIMAEPEYIERTGRAYQSTWTPAYNGVSY